MMGYFWMGGGGFTWLLIWAALVVIPFWKILPTRGVQAPFALFAIIPVGVIVLLWIIAFKDDTGTKSNGA
jgi:hypothetical protein